MTGIKIGSFNVRGIRDHSKRLLIFKYLREKELDVVFLQECHSSSKDETLWNSQWGSKIYFSHGERNAKGTAVCFKKNVKLAISKTHIDTNGRMVMVEIELESQKILLANIYAPNEDDQNLL